MRENAPPLSSQGRVLHLDVLGPLTIRCARDGEAVRLARQPKRAALLVYLAMRGGQPVRRDELLALFWPDSSTSRARSSLRQAIHFIRSSSSPATIQSNGSEEVGLGEGTVTCDATDFEDLLEGQLIEPALKLYHGDFLEGFHVEASNELEDWIEARRRHLREQAAAGAWSLAETARDQGRAERASYWGKRSLDLSSLSDHAVRRTMALLEQVGDRSGALRAYAGLEERLQRDHGVAPDAVTRSLRDRIAGQDVTEGRAPLEELGPRRTQPDRRQGDRRSHSGDRQDGPDRRRGGDRRVAERRSGRDRRR